MKEKEIKVKQSLINLDFCSILTLIFVIFKLLDKIEWSWWLVFSPLIIEYGVIGIAFILIGIASLLFPKNVIFK